MTWPFGDARPGGYGCIIADPPWHFALHSAKGEGKSPQAHYACMSLAEIAALPVGRLAAPDCALFLWATAPMILDALAVMAAWGFTYKTMAPWAKQSKGGTGWAFGTGFILRSAAEYYLVGTIGQPKVRSHSVRGLIVAPVREHSRKPEQLHADAEALYAGPYIELFARQRRPGWHAWGNQVERFSPARSSGGTRGPVRSA
jgi:N6-adenosine-specific RNA methylase IME4